jgi:hypothetical protein
MDDMRELWASAREARQDRSALRLAAAREELAAHPFREQVEELGPFHWRLQLCPGAWLDWWPSTGRWRGGGRATGLKGQSATYEGLHHVAQWWRVRNGVMS